MKVKTMNLATNAMQPDTAGIDYKLSLRRPFRFRASTGIESLGSALHMLAAH